MNIEETALSVYFSCPAGQLSLSRPRDGERPEIVLTSMRTGVEERIVLARIQRNAEIRAFQVWVWAFAQLREAEIRAATPWWRKAGRWFRRFFARKPQVPVVQAAPPPPALPKKAEPVSAPR